MKFEWYFDEEQFNDAQESTVEDDIYGWVYCETDNDKYIVDVHKEYYSANDNGYDLEIYHEDNVGGHGLWLGNVNSIRSSASLERFKKRAEKKLKEYITAEEAEAS